MDLVALPALRPEWSRAVKEGWAWGRKISILRRLAVLIEVGDRVWLSDLQVQAGYTTITLLRDLEYAEEIPQ